MRAVGNVNGEQHRELLFWYIVFFTFTLLPGMVASPYRGFVQGQPELQQEMDNLMTPDQRAQNDVDKFGGVGVYRRCLIYKAMTVLLQAEKLLHVDKDVQERQWLETFVHKLKELAEVLEDGVEAAFKKEMQNSTGEDVQTRKDPADDHFITPLTLMDTDIPDVKRSFKLTTKSPVTLSEASQDMKINKQGNQQQAVTKPGLYQFSQKKKSRKSLLENDILVQELEALRSNRASEKMGQMKFKSNTFRKDNVDILRVLDEDLSSPISAQVLVSPGPAEAAANSTSPEFSTARNTPNFPLVVSAKPENISMNLNNQLSLSNSEVKKSSDSHLQVMVNELEHLKGNSGRPSYDEMFNQNPNFANNFNRIPADNLPQRSGMQYQRFRNFNGDVTVPKTNSNGFRQSYVRLPSFYPPNQFVNSSYQEMRINFPPVNRQVITKQYLTRVSNYARYPKQHVPYSGIKNTIQNLKNQHLKALAFGNQNQNYLMKTHDLSYPQNDIIVPARPNPFLGSNSKFFHDPYTSNSEGGKMAYAPDPYFNSMNYSKNSMPENKAIASSSNLSTEFSDEMKRDLRDGKVILLSDSVVPSNFEEKENDSEVAKTTQSDKAEKKNET